MKLLQIFAAGIVTITAVSNYLTAAQPSVLINGLVAYYPFNGNARDETGNGHDGIVKETKLNSDRFGRINSSYGFDNSEIFVPYDPAFNSSSITVSVWVKTTIGGTIIARMQNFGSGGIWGFEGDAIILESNGLVSVENLSLKSNLLKNHQ